MVSKTVLGGDVLLFYGGALKSPTLSVAADFHGKAKTGVGIPFPRISWNAPAGANAPRGNGNSQKFPEIPRNSQEFETALKLQYQECSPIHSEDY